MRRKKRTVKIIQKIFIATEGIQFFFLTLQRCRCYITDIERRMLVFEDLRNQQFKNVDRIFGLDTDHMKLTLHSLAKWHAGTATLLLTVCLSIILI